MSVGELIQTTIKEITSLQGPPAVIITIIFVGYALKMIPSFPNRFIPLVSFALGPLLTLVLVGWPTSGTMAPGLRWPEIAAWMTAIIQGFLLACAAWLSHAKVLRAVIDDKVPALKRGNTDLFEKKKDDAELFRKSNEPGPVP